MDEEISKQIARRDSYRRKLALLKTPNERMRDMQRLQASMWATFALSPEGYAHFLRRNYKARSTSYRPPDAQ